MVTTIYLMRHSETLKYNNINNNDSLQIQNEKWPLTVNGENIAKRKKLRYREDILDNMGSDELIANLFRISQTEQKLKNEDIKLEKEANKTHYEVGSEIRNTIKRLGGMMPENLPTLKKSLKELEEERKSNNKQLHNKNND